MSQTIYIGKPTKFVGKSVFEILCNLKNFGVGRVIQRNLYKQMYPEPCYFKITNVAPQMDDELKYGRVWGIEIFRGKKYPYIREAQPQYHDYSLLRVHEEPDFDKFPVLGEAQDHIIVLPRKISSPPVLAELFNRTQTGLKPLYISPSDPKKSSSQSFAKFDLEAKYPKEKSSEFHYWYRVAREGEMPTMDFSAPIKHLKE